MRGFAILIAALASAGAPALANSSDVSEVCAAAEARYVELFGAPSAEAEGVHVVTMYEYQFCPRDITVKAGDTVRWVNVDKRTSHSVIVGDEPESERAFPEDVIDVTFPTTGGPFQVRCGPHWERRGMIGAVTVVE